MRDTMRIIFAVYDGFELLDVTGPSTVFEVAGRLAGRDLYQSIMVSSNGDPTKSASSLTVQTTSTRDIAPEKADFLLVPGADREDLFAAMEDPHLTDWLKHATRVCGRYGSVCSGALLLANTQIATGRTISSHWDACSTIAERYPDVSVDPDSIFTNDGPLWTSAGVTTGIDMALAVVEHDHGTALSAKVAKHLVVFARRQGNQSQFSTFLEAQTRVASHDIRPAVDWMIENPSRSVTVAELAGISGMTERTFYRRFEAAFGVSPAKFLERLRLDRAKSLLEEGLAPKEVATRVGFRSYSGFRASFLRTFDLSPAAHQHLHGQVSAF